MTQMLSQSITEFPEGEIKPGESWEKNSHVFFPMIGDLDFNVKNTLESLADDVAKVKMVGKMEMKPIEEDDAADPKDPFAALRKLMKITESTLDGTVEFDNEQGLIKKKVQNTTLIINIRGQEVHTKQSSILELESFKPAK